jgi:hypothetical protein
MRTLRRLELAIVEPEAPPSTEADRVTISRRAVWGDAGEYAAGNVAAQFEATIPGGSPVTIDLLAQTTIDGGSTSNLDTIHMITIEAPRSNAETVTIAPAVSDGWDTWIDGDLVLEPGGVVHAESPGDGWAINGTSNDVTISQAGGGSDPDVTVTITILGRGV